MPLPAGSPHDLAAAQISSAAKLCCSLITFGLVVQTLVNLRTLVNDKAKIHTCLYGPKPLVNTCFPSQKIIHKRLSF